eukprot:GEMP01055390.1.p1 GENE.GEMP01055390.1~~GEMP01055390.1.p1  ORF type:complete len:373 (+),score=71.56 GEMP01055390.1:223-1341(+)
MVHIAFLCFFLSYLETVRAATTTTTTTTTTPGIVAGKECQKDGAACADGTKCKDNTDTEQDCSVAESGKCKCVKEEIAEGQECHKDGAACIDGAKCKDRTNTAQDCSVTEGGKCKCLKEGNADSAKGSSDTCADNDASFQASKRTGGDWNEWTCAKAAEAGYCDDQTESGRSTRTHCAASCDLCSSSAVVADVFSVLGLILLFILILLMLFLLMRFCLAKSEKTPEEQGDAAKPYHEILKTNSKYQHDSARDAPLLELSPRVHQGNDANFGDYMSGLNSSTQSAPRPGPRALASSTPLSPPTDSITPTPNNDGPESPRGPGSGQPPIWKTRKNVDGSSVLDERKAWSNKQRIAQRARAKKRRNRGPVLLTPS